MYFNRVFVVYMIDFSNVPMGKFRHVAFQQQSKSLKILLVSDVISTSSLCVAYLVSSYANTVLLLMLFSKLCGGVFI